jgi:allophanate hydrolase
MTLFARAFQDRALAAVASRLHHALPAATIGSTRRPLPALAPVAPSTCGPARFEIAVVGAHLSGEPLNRELTEAGARLERTARTARRYSLFLLSPEKPGLVFDGTGAGAIEIEIWSLPAAAFADFVASIPAPLGIGTISLADGSTVQGFLCEAHAVRGRRDITAFGGWRAYRCSMER